MMNLKINRLKYFLLMLVTNMTITVADTSVARTINSLDDFNTAMYGILLLSMIIVLPIIYMRSHSAFGEQKPALLVTGIMGAVYVVSTLSVISAVAAQSPSAEYAGSWTMLISVPVGLYLLFKPEKQK